MHKFDAHRLVGLIVRYPKHKWHFKVWQFMWIKMHVEQCTVCQDNMDNLIKSQPPQIGRSPEPN